ncbi:hypothetical protein SKAU_G00186540 [Synaphobranchus kaupii]|uniref:Uncharacterized protein n=1 Tax=Synaphobranchus kaupii TaxID=118154 RepID=A0A9Q1FCL3_SYNKA|nr:hypothetical protein SKAU_G00186540 [Synaphobranchus kaupii]
MQSIHVREEKRGAEARQMLEADVKMLPPPAWAAARDTVNKSKPPLKQPQAPVPACLIALNQERDLSLKPDHYPITSPNSITQKSLCSLRRSRGKGAVVYFPPRRRVLGSAAAVSYIRIRILRGGVSSRHRL